MYRKYGLEIGVAILSALLVVVMLIMNWTRTAVHILTSENEESAVIAQIPAGGTNETIDAVLLEDTYWLFLPSTVENAMLTVDDRMDGMVLNNRTLTLTEQNKTIRILTGSGHPCIFLKTRNDIALVQADENKETSDEGTATILLPGGGLAYNGELEDIHGRGNASWDQDKKGYNITLGEEAEIPGLSAAHEEYALVSHTDKSYVRNRTSMEIMRAAGGLALDYVTVDLYINGEYQGLYELHEKVNAEDVHITDLAERNKSLNSSDDKPEQVDTGVYAEDWNTSVTGKWWNYRHEPSDVTGGYIIEANDAIRYEERNSGFMTSLGAYFTLKSPSKASVSEYEYISSYAQQVEDTMLSIVGSDSYETLSSLVDVRSFEAKYLVEEISKNIDTCVTSQFFYKDAGGILYAGPVWDHDWAYGVERIQGEVDYTDPEGFSANVITGSFPWYQLLYYNQAFQSDVKSLYRNSLSAVVLDIANSRIAAWQQELERSAVMDLILWNSFDSHDPDEVRTRFYAEGEHVSDFLVERDAFLLEQWAQ